MFMSISDAMCDYELLISPQTCLSPWLPPRFHSWVHLEPMAPWTPSATTGPDSECPIRFRGPLPSPASGLARPSRLCSVEPPGGLSGCWGIEHKYPQGVCSRNGVRTHGEVPSSPDGHFSLHWREASWAAFDSLIAACGGESLSLWEAQLPLLLVTVISEHCAK